MLLRLSMNEGVLYSDLYSERVCYSDFSMGETVCY